MTTAAYVRLSRDKPDQTSIARQLSDIRKLCDLRGWPEPDVYEDVDLSAYKSVRRPSYERLKADIAAGTVDRVVFWKADRIARNLLEFLQFNERCKEAGVTIASVADQYDTSTPTGIAMMQMIGVFAELESGTISYRVSSARRLEAASGKPHMGGRRKFGYTRAMEIDPGEAAVIRRAAADILSGGTLGAVCRSWAAAGIVTPHGNVWTLANLSRMLKSPHIAGLRLHKGAVVAGGGWPAIIPPETHYELVAALRGLPGAGHRGRVHLLTGIARCGRCGARLISHSVAAGRRSYWCPSQPGREGCGGISVNQVGLDEFVRDQVLKFVDSPELLDAARQSPAGPDPEVGALEERLEKARGAEGLIDQADYLELVANLEAQLDAARLRAAKWARPALLDLPTGAEALRAWWDSHDVADRYELVAMVLEQVIVDPAVRGRKGFDPSRVPPDNLRWKA